MRLHPVTSLAMIGACSPGRSLPGGGEGRADAAPYSAYEPDSASAAAPMTAAQLTTAIEAGLRMARRLEPALAFAAYEEAMAAREPEIHCPLSNDDSTLFTAWGSHYANCSTSAGVVFDGMAAYEQSGDHARGLTNVDCSIDYPDGSRFEAVGRLFGEVDRLDDGRSRMGWGAYHGRFYWDGPAGQGTWLAEDELWLDLSQYVYDFPATEGRMWFIDGGLSLGEELDGWDGTLNLHELVLYARGEPEGAYEPSGSVMIRDAVGARYQVDFDGPVLKSDLTLPLSEALDADDCDATGDCDGCGTVSYEGETLDMEVCPDFSALIAPGLPWEPRIALAPGGAL